MFRRVIRFLMRRWVIGLLAIVILGTLIWLVGPLVAIAEHKPLATEVARFGVILGLLLIWGFDNLRARDRERTAGEMLTRSLVREGKPQQQGTAAVVDAEQTVLAQKLREALKILQRAKLHKGQKLYQLPWYVVIGAPGSGKTTALKNAGLRFPLESQLGDNPVQGAGGTRYCDWWFTDQAVLLDTAGRYTTQDNPKESAGQAWLGFLGDLRKGRPKRPLNGIIVAVSVQDLLTKTPTQQAMQATAIKRRIQELNDHLDMELPVYVLLTKCDLIAGFNEFFADLDHEDRAQPWGITFALGKASTTGEKLAKFSEQFRALLVRANDRVLYRLNAEADPNRRGLVFDFPRQVLSLDERLTAFLQDVFTPNQFEQPALLRGVFLVSGTQTGGASQWVSGVLPTSVCSPPISAAATAAPRGFFLQSVFQQVIFGEAQLAAANRRSEKRFRWSYGALLLLIGLSLAGAGSAIYLSEKANAEFLDTVDSGIDAHRQATGGGLKEGQRDWPLLARGMETLHALPAAAADEAALPPWMEGIGLDQHEKVGSQAQWVYRTALERHFLPRVDAELARQIEQAQSRDDYLYESLRFYLMLHQPAHMDRKTFSVWTDLMWSRLYPGETNAALRETLARHLQYALDENVPPPPIDQKLVESARDQLARTPLDVRVYRRLKSEYAEDLTGQFSVEGVLGRKAEALFFRRSGAPLHQGVSEFFTYKVFHTRVLIDSKRFAGRLKEESWIYGNDGPAALKEEEVEAVGERVRALYLDEYRQAWQQWLDDLAVKRFTDPGDGRVVAQLLASGDTPLVKLLLAIREHTALGEPPAGAKTAGKVAAIATQNVMVNQRRQLEGVLPQNPGAAVRLPGGEVSDAFSLFNEYATDAEGLPLHRLQQSFAGLNRYLDALAESDDRKQAAFEVSRDPQQGGTAIKEVRSALAASPALIRKWFGSVTADTERVTNTATAAHTNDVWGAEVLPFYEKAIKGRYPVDPQSTREISIDDFARFFGPGGVLANYFATYVKPFADTSQRDWSWRKGVGMSAETLRLFQRAKRIEDAWFDGGGKLNVGFTLRPHALDAVVTRSLLDVSGVPVTYDHGPIRATVHQWPRESGEQSRLVMNLASQGTPLSVHADGEWGWFRLLDRHAQTERLSEGGVMLIFSVQGLNARYELKPQRAASPFTDNAVQNFELPVKL